MKKKLKICWTAVLLCLLLCALLLPWCAALTLDQVEENSCWLTLVFQGENGAVPGMNFSVYRVADVLRAGKYQVIDPYTDYNIWGGTANWLSRAETLSGLVARDQLPADRTGTTDGQGRLDFTGLAKGLYLVVGSTNAVNGYLYLPGAFFVSLPNSSDGLTWQSGVEARVKYDYIPLSTSRRIHVIKQWDDAEHEDERPASVTVDLLRDGRVYSTATLSQENNWRYDWNGLNQNYHWQVVEQEVENYSTTVSQSGITYVISNTYHKEDDVIIVDPSGPPLTELPSLPPDPEQSSSLPVQTPKPGEGDIEIVNTPPPGAQLPQTGQLWWPVPPLALMGLLLILLGMRRRSGSDSHEE